MKKKTSHLMDRTGLFGRFSDWFIHNDLKDNVETYIKSKKLVFIVWMGVIFFTINMIKWFHLKCYQLGISLAVITIIIVGMVFIFKHTKWFTVTSNFIMAALVWHFFYLSYLTGGFDSSSMMWMVTIPVLASAYCGSGIAFLWSTVVFFGFIVFCYLKISGYELPVLDLSPKDLLASQIANVFGPLIALLLSSWYTNMGLEHAFEAQRDTLNEQKESYQQLQSAFQRISETIQTITCATEVLHHTSDELSSQANDMQSKSKDAMSATHKISNNIKNMASATEEVSTQISTVSTSSNRLADSLKVIGKSTSHVTGSLNTVAKSAEEMSLSIHLIATSIDEMYSSLNEVSQNTGKGANIINAASDMAEKASSTINSLGDAAREIWDVVELIKGIASQTNLLALNATIEAAGAGDAGKGFTVVANEVKALARQTAGATEDIREKIEGMQSNANSAITAIKNIVSVVTDANTVMNTIAAAVEEQTATINEISKNCTETASSANNVSENVQKAAQTATNTAKDLLNAVKTGLDVSDNLSQVAEAVVGIAMETTKISDRTDIVQKNVNGLNTAIDITFQSAVKIKSEAKTLNNLLQQLRGCNPI